MAEEKEKQESSAATSSQEKNQSAKKSKNNVPLIAAIVLGVVVIEAAMLFGFFQLVKPEDPKKAEAKHAQDSLKHAAHEQTTIGTVMEEPIEAIVNIAGTDGARFLKVEIKFEYDAVKYKKIGEELEKRHAKIQDLLIEYLSGLTLKELEDPDIRTQIRKDFLHKVNATIPHEEGQISNVFLSDFIIQ